MFKLKIIKRPRAGYSTKTYSWRCPLCLDFYVAENLEDGYVVAHAINHLMEFHRIHYDRIKVRYKIKE